MGREFGDGRRRRRGLGGRRRILLLGQRRRGSLRRILGHERVTAGTAGAGNALIVNEHRGSRLEYRLVAVGLTTTEPVHRELHVLGEERRVQAVEIGVDLTGSIPCTAAQATALAGLRRKNSFMPSTSQMFLPGPP